MGHLNELHEKFAAEGLVVVCVTKEPRASVDAYIKEQGCKFPIMIEESDTGGLYGVTSIPHAVLIAPNGRVRWRGHPSDLTTPTIGKHIEETKPLPPLPEALESVTKALAKNEFLKAREKAAQAAQHKDEAVVAAAAKACAWIDAFAESTISAGQTDREAGRMFEAWAAFDLVAKGYKGTDHAKTAEERIKELLADKDAKHIVEAGQKWEKLLGEIGELSAKKAIKKLAPFVKKYEGTPAGDSAAKKLAALEAGE